MLFHDCFVFAIPNERFKTYLYLNYADAKPCAIDVKCGSHSTCMVDPLFPKTPICKCEVGYKKTKKGKCVGEFNRIYFSIFAQ